MHDDGIEIKATWREEWVVNLERRYTHGGILAALVDLGADWAMVRKLGRGVPTIDMRVDYHAVALPGDLTIKGKIVRMGSQFSTAEASDLRRAGQAAGQRPRHLFHRAAAAAEDLRNVDEQDNCCDFCASSMLLPAMALAADNPDWAYPVTPPARAARQRAS